MATKNQKLTTSTVALAASLGFIAGTVIGNKLLSRLEKNRVKDNEDAEDESTCIYLDYNGSTPIYPQVLEAMMPYLTKHYGNSSSSHYYAKEPRRAIDEARSRILFKLLEAPSGTPLSTIWFTSCGTESDNLAIHLALQSSAAMEIIKNGDLPHIVTCNIEHPAIEGCLKILEQEGRCSVTFVPVQPDGRVLATDMTQAIRPATTILVTLMTANNEVGSLQPVKEVSQYCQQLKPRPVLFHTDAAQAAGKVSVTLESLGYPDMISLVGHKLGAPKGVACLYVRDQSTASFLAHNHGVVMIGGSQEFGRRAGTSNTPSIVAMGVAAVQAAEHLTENASHMESMRNRLLNKLLQDEVLGGGGLVRVNGPNNASDRLPNTLSVGIKGVHSGLLLQAIGDQVAASAGATCHSCSSAPVSSILQAMGVPLEFARGTLRLSLGPKTTADQIDRAAAIIAREAKRQLGLLK